MARAARPAKASNPAEAGGMVDLVDERGVPISAGVPPIVRIAAAIGLVMIFMVIGTVIFASGAGHVWPSTDAVKIDLSKP